MIRVLIADDHAVVRAGLKQILAATDDIHVCGEAATGPEAVTAVRTTPFDVVVLDLSMPGRSGVDLIRQLKTEQPALRVLVLSAHQEEQYAVRTLKAGASGYLTKESAPESLVAAIRKVAAGGAFISPEVAQQLALGVMPGGDSSLHASLSDRELEVFLRLASGESVSEIAERLNLSVKTVSTHKSRILQKMNMTRDAELIRYAVEHNLVESARKA
ncbi:MAG TPA: response regulator transcription factor [Burkholderiales bacterium]|nr:response regulator transcription factor [Burkholderiales bacterium]